eukprot:m.522833 g.522833  ORF g.522833 m.522833 type:complete len:345 (-) comp21970_c1_seq6:921-1955(-)
MVGQTAKHAIAAHMVLASLNVPLLELAKVDGAYPFSPTVIPLYTDGLKWVVSFVLLWMECDWSIASAQAKFLGGCTGVGEIFKYAAPGGLYAICNNIGVFVLLYISPGEVMLLSQLRVLFTALLSVVILGKRYDSVQVSCLLILACSMVQLSHRTDCSDTSADPVADSTFGYSTQFIGVFLCTLQSFMSSLATVYNQKLLGRVHESIHIANIKLYSFGILFAWMLHAGADSQRDESDAATHMTVMAVVYIVNMAFFGLAVSQLLRHAGAVVKLFSGAGATALVFVYMFVYYGFIEDPDAPGNSDKRGTLAQGLAGVSIFAALYIFVQQDSPKPAAESLPVEGKN